VKQYLPQTNSCENHEIDIQMLEAFSNLTDDMYVIDFYRRKFIYVSPRIMLLCGHTVAEALELSYDFYPKVIYGDDFKLLVRIHQVSLEYLSGLESPRKLKYIKFNIRIVNTRQPLMIDHKLTPLYTPEGKIRIAACKVSAAVVDTPGNLMAKFDNGELYRYSFENGKWRSCRAIKLTPREKEILNLARHGKVGHEIADMLCINHQSLRNHESNIYRKLGTTNLMASVIYATNHSLI
jgi:DNA-binding CsgD family transcriptional regulator